MFFFYILQNDFVGYAACVLIELIDKKSEPHIEIFYKKSADENVATPIFIPNCGFSCSLEMVYRLYSKILPSSTFENECLTKVYL